MQCKLLVKNIELDIGLPLEALKEAAAEKAGVLVSDVSSLTVIKRSLDARKRSKPHYVYTAAIGGDFSSSAISKNELFVEEEIKPLKTGTEEINGRIVVAGTGPCGLFCAYLLSKHGYKPIVIERGSIMQKREAAFLLLRDKGVLSRENNVCFGEGGAGTFSDGKLTTRIKDPHAKSALKLLNEHGASDSVLYNTKAHVGTDVIRKTVVSMRNEIIRMGGEVFFDTKLTDIEIKSGGLKSISVKNAEKTYKIDTNCLVLAIGHSARDTYEMLLKRGVYMEPKSFAVGMRAEHKRSVIDESQYGNAEYSKILGAADYKLTARAKDRGVFSFCVCPGGEVVCSATENNMTAVNGMSYSARDGEKTNGAIVVSVNKNDYFPGPLGGVEFQRMLETKAYEAAGGYGAFYTDITTFLGKGSKRSSLYSSYRPYVVKGRPDKVFPNFITEALKYGLSEFCLKIKGFDGGILLGAETRTSSPVRITRDENFLSMRGIYPAGEGAGYAGGIVSAAADGLKVAEKIIERFKP